jgi:PPM family protein phosphatase
VSKYRDGELDLSTQNHTVTAEMVRRGDLRPDQVPRHRLRHVITNVVGGGELGVRVEAHAFDVRAWDRLLLGSDGLTEMVPHESIAATLHAEGSPEAAAKALLSQANAAGGRANITVVVGRFDLAESGRLSRVSCSHPSRGGRRFSRRQSRWSLWAGWSVVLASDPVRQ